MEFVGNCAEVEKRPGRGETGPLTYAERAWMRSYEVSLNRRVAVEELLIAVANGKRDLLSREECRELAAKLGVPDDFMSPKKETPAG